MFAEEIKPGMRAWLWRPEETIADIYIIQKVHYCNSQVADLSGVACDPPLRWCIHEPLRNCYPTARACADAMRARAADLLAEAARVEGESDAHEG